MRVLGIDPGSITTGYGIVEEKGNLLVHIENGAFYSKRKDPFPKRLHSIYTQLKKTIERFGPDALALEEVFMAKNVKSAIHLGHARGIILLAASEKDVPVYEYSSKEIKKAVVGYGNAAKEQVQMMIKRILRLPEAATEDAADALAAAICHIHSSQIQKRLPIDEKRRRMNSQ